MPSTARYGLLDQESAPVFRVSFTTFCFICAVLVNGAFFFCVAYSVLYYFEAATRTHCQVYNALPSLSAAIGSFSPQKEVWQWAMFLHALPRYYLILGYWNMNRLRLHHRDWYLCNVVSCLSFLEITSLLILSVWTSSKYYAVHEKAFITFIVSSVAHMVCLCMVFSRHRVKENRDKLSLRLKKRFAVVNVICILAAGYFFVRHNAKCEPYVYTYFALAEYIVVLSNICFHLTSYWDFKSKEAVFYKWGVTLCDRWEYVNY